MKSLLIFSLFILPLSLKAATCAEVWKSENAKNKVLESCHLEGAIELVKLEKGCAFPSSESEPCFVLRSCDAEKEIGASLFRKSAPLSAYCVSGKELEVHGGSDKNGVKAFITCSGVQKPTGIKLVDHAGKSKVCPFPFGQP